MVSSNSASVSIKDAAKTPAASIKSPLKRSVSTSPSHKNIEDEVLYLRAQNKLLKSALNAVKDTASEKLSKSYELVWYARNRTRYPSHEASKWLDNSKEHSDDIDNLRGMNGDFHHGFNSGMLAASRMFKEQADVHDGDSDCEPFEAAAQHKKKVVESKESFPNLQADAFPTIRSD